jgi:hypothetical protein
VSLLHCLCPFSIGNEPSDSTTSEDSDYKSTFRANVILLGLEASSASKTPALSCSLAPLEKSNYIRSDYQIDDVTIVIGLDMKIANC